MLSKINEQIGWQFGNPLIITIDLPKSFSFDLIFSCSLPEETKLFLNFHENVKKLQYGSPWLIYTLCIFMPCLKKPTKFHNSKLT